MGTDHQEYTQTRVPDLLDGGNPFRSLSGIDGKTVGPLEQRTEAVASFDKGRLSALVPL
ncbi:hypothetical protein PM082_017439 [Marasmius tenuissimus]|nr:hypothetical protein PM082_017439 [Marasmius tenuissimus]